MREFGRKGGRWVGRRGWGCCSPVLRQCNHDRRSPPSRQRSQTLLTFSLYYKHTHLLSLGAHTHTLPCSLSHLPPPLHLPAIQSFCIRSDALHFRYSSCAFSSSSSPVQCVQSHASCYAPARAQSEHTQREDDRKAPKRKAG